VVGFLLVADGGDYVVDEAVLCISDGDKDGVVAVLVGTLKEMGMIASQPMEEKLNVLVLDVVDVSHHFGKSVDKVAASIRRRLAP